MMRYYLGVDWADQRHAIWVSDETGQQVRELTVEQTPEGLSEFGGWLYECQAQGIVLWAAIEKPEGRIVDFLLDHGVVVYPVNPKAVDRARDRFRMSTAKSDRFDAWVLAEFLRTDHPHLRALQPSSEPAQELKLLTRDYQRLVRQQTRLLNQLTATLKEYYPRPLEVFDDVTTPLARDFLRASPTPETAAALSHAEWEAFGRAHRLSAERIAELWEQLSQPQLPVPAHVVRAKARLVRVLVDQLEVTLGAVEEYRQAVVEFFAALPVAEIARTLPGGKTGTTLPTLWAELGDAVGRWASDAHMQAQAGTVPVTKQSGKMKSVQFRVACNKHLRYAVALLAFLSLRQSEWAKAYDKAQRARGHTHQRALRALGAKWLKIVFVMWKTHTPYDENVHLANMTRQHLRQTG